MNAQFTKLLIILTFFVTCSYAQIAAKADSDIEWTRIETADKDLSFVLPPDFIVDAEKRERGQRYNIIGFQNDVRMKITVYKDDTAKQRFQMMRPPNAMNLLSFEKNGFKGIRLSSIETAKIYKETISLLNGDNYYVLSLMTDDKNKSEVERFLFSIKLKGDNLFVAPTEKKYAEEPVSISSLSTNPEVIEAFKRKSEKKKGGAKTEVSSTEDEFISYLKYSRPPIFLNRPNPNYRPSIKPVDGVQSFSVRLKLELLADGQVGDITILSISEKEFINSCVEAARKIKFLPAQINGENADSVKIVDYTMELYTITTTTISPPQKRF